MDYTLKKALFFIVLFPVIGCGNNGTTASNTDYTRDIQEFMGFDLIITHFDTLDQKDRVKQHDTVVPRDIHAARDLEVNTNQDSATGCETIGCDPGYWCNGDKCEPCNVNSHCTAKCLDCTKFGRICSDDGKTCLECSADNSCQKGYRCVDGKCNACNTAGFCGDECTPCVGETPDCVGGLCACNDLSCSTGRWCGNGKCEACKTDTHCGMECVDCTLTGTPVCTDGKCRCTTGGQCGKGKWCSNGTCEKCGQNDPLHCGSDCAVCTGKTPICENGGCKCSSHEDCGQEFWCNAGKCEACDTGLRCGPDCIACGKDTPDCRAGECVCNSNSCAEGAYCDKKGCKICKDNEPAHCGFACLTCSGRTPACVSGTCVCQAGSCGKSNRCENGACIACNTNQYCGPDCTACSGDKPFCKADGTGCAQCLHNIDCGTYRHCDNGTCQPDVEGCITDSSPSGKKCSKAKIIGRKNAAMGYLYQGDTTHAGNNDDLPSGLFEPSDCWDANNDNAFRIFLLKGDRITVRMVPNAPKFDGMLKLYTGTACAAHKKDDLVGCYNHGGDRKMETFGYTATSRGWYSIVVDGRSAFDEDGDWGPYSLSVSLDCVEKNCNCL